MNTTLFRFLNSTIKSPFLDQVLPAFSDKDFVVIPGIILIGLALYFGRRHARTCVLALLLALALSDITTEKLLKNVFQSPRPYATLKNVHHHRSGRWVLYQPEYYAMDRRRSYGFPSSHAANTAAAALVLFLFCRRSIWLGLPLALLVGLSRIYTGNHYPFDVLAGYIWGGLCAIGAVFASRWLVKRIWGPPDEPAPPLPLPPQRKAFYWLLGIWTLFNFAYVHFGPFDLAADVAQYWDWSRRLALGYYSKPPLIAYVIALLTGAGGNKEWAIRNGAVLFSSGTLALIYALTARIARNERAALLAAILCIATPFTWAGSVLMTIDPLLVFFWTLAMYAFHQAVNEKPRMWWLVGLALGLGMLAKYTTLFLYISFALYLAFYDRRHLRQKGPYLALGLSLLCLSGVVYWNWQNDWVSIVHTVNIGAGSRKSLGRSIGHFGEFFAGQAGIVSPILFFFLFWNTKQLATRMKQDRNAAFLFLSFAVLFAFYALVALTRPPQANWPVAAYVAAIVGFAWVWCDRINSSAKRYWLVVGIMLGCVIGVFARSTDLLYLLSDKTAADHSRIHLLGMTIDPDTDPTNKLRGGRELGQAVSAYLDPPVETMPFIFSDRYQLTAWLAFYTEGRPHTYCLDTGVRRYNQYDLWGGWDKLVGRDGLFVTGGDAERAQAYIQEMVERGMFESGHLLETVTVRRGPVEIRDYTLSIMQNFSGTVIENKDHTY